jgi:hypothetical protein
MAGTLHEAESVIGMTTRENPMGQGNKFTPCKELHNLPEQFARQLLVLSDKLVDVDAKIRQVAA